jgi:3-oxoacyl-[acyl-carrier-protein] synthase II
VDGVPYSHTTKVAAEIIRVAYASSLRIPKKCKLEAYATSSTRSPEAAKHWVITAMSDSKRAVFTGVGIISPVGIGTDAFWQSVAAQKSGISKVELLEASALPMNIAAEVKDFTEVTAKKEYLKKQRKSLKVMCREIKLGVASAHLALADCNVDLEVVNHERLGVEFGANQMFSPAPVLAPGGFACATDDNQFIFDDWGTLGLEQMEPLWLLKYLPNMPACHIGIHADARGPNNSLTLAESSGNAVLGEALRIIQRGRADLMLSGSCGSRIHPTKCLHAALWDALASYEDEDPATWSRPFNSSSKGQVVGEGACTFMLEEEEHAKARGADILGSVLGAGSSCVRSREGEPNHRLAITHAVNKALKDAGISSDDVGHINAHGLGVQAIDRAEADAIKDVFGNRAATVPVTAPKSFLGNSGAACGMLEIATSLFGLKNGVVPATINYSPDTTDCGLNVVHGEALSIDNKVFLNVNVTGNGQAAALVCCGV